MEQSSMAKKSRSTMPVEVTAAAVEAAVVDSVEVAAAADLEEAVAAVATEVTVMEDTGVAAVVDMGVDAAVATVADAVVAADEEAATIVTRMDTLPVNARRVVMVAAAEDVIREDSNPFGFGCSKDDQLLTFNRKFHKNASACRFNFLFIQI